MASAVLAETLENLSAGVLVPIADLLHYETIFTIFTFFLFI
jgi:hypothetical protein